ncbi:MAG: acetate--CoA ligase [Chloroflexi bacterium]|nr:acetate--CoA ligase [Chloroflexota bacterium]MDA1003489.1 acetate--CoA ligase [Chloroflexota bacterium]
MVDLVSPIVRRWQEDARNDPDAFWDRAASELPWLRKWDTVFEADPPSFKWFLGAQTNLSYQALDHHVAHGRGGHAALIALEESGARRVYTYAQLLYEVERIAAALRGIGVQQGDRVAVYMPTNAEAIALMLACARIGALHMVVFAGFGAGALAERVKLSGAKVLFASDITYRRGRNVPLDGIVRDALDAEGAGAVVERVIVHRRGDGDVPIAPGKEMSWEAFLEGGAGQDRGYVALESNTPAYILATSGTTARPKLAVHTHGPYAVHIASMAKWMFGLKPEDVWWATSDIGWVVGHSYIVYAPLLVGCTTISFEGSLDFPDEGTLYRIVEENRISSVFTSPTAIRLLMRVGPEPAERYDLSSIDRVFSAGEVLNPPAWEWFQREIFHDRVPVIDHMWQTETGGPMIGNPYGLGMLPIKPGSSGVPLPGVQGRILTPEGEPVPNGEKGIFVVDRPFPGLIAQLWGEPERYGNDYWNKIPGKQVYFTGDAAMIDDDGYVWFSGRADEIIKIAAHRLGTIEVESAILRHPAVAEAGVTGRPDELRGEVISAFVVLKRGFEASDALRAEVLQTVRNEMGPIAVIGELNFVHLLPKTRSGKIMRRVLKAVTLNLDPGDISTIEDEGSVEDARDAWQQMRESITKS